MSAEAHGYGRGQDGSLLGYNHCLCAAAQVAASDWHNSATVGQAVGLESPAGERRLLFSGDDTAVVVVPSAAAAETVVVDEALAVDFAASTASAVADVEQVAPVAAAAADALVELVALLEMPPSVPHAAVPCFQTHGMASSSAAFCLSRKDVQRSWIVPGHAVVPVRPVSTVCALSSVTQAVEMATVHHHRCQVCRSKRTDYESSPVASAGLGLTVMAAAEERRLR